jgi:hypothetical protein
LGKGYHHVPLPGVGQLYGTRMFGSPVFSSGYGTPSALAGSVFEPFGQNLQFSAASMENQPTAALINRMNDIAMLQVSSII